MSMIPGFGDEVTWFALVSLVVILLLSVAFVQNAFSTHPVRPIESPTSDLSDVSETSDSTVSQRDGTTHDRGDSTDSLITSNANEIDEDSAISDEAVHELDSSNEGEIVVVGEETKIEESNASNVNDLCHEDSKQKSSSSAQRTSAASESDSCDATHTNNLSGSQAASPSVTSSARTREEAYSDQIVIRLKYLNDMERTISTRLSKTIQDVKRDHFSEELAANKIVRLIFNGQVLQNEVTLQHCGVSDGCVIHVHISQSRPQQSTTIDSNVDLDLSNLLWPLLSIILVLLWIMYFKYPQFFNITSTGILLIFTGGFIFLYGESRLQTRN